MFNPQTSLQRSPLVRLCKSLLTWRIQRRLLMALALLITLIALFYTVENTRGARAWNRLAREYAGRGESLNIDAFRPPAVPDDQNFAMTPPWQDLLRFEWDEEEQREKWAGSASDNRPYLTAHHQQKRGPETGNWQRAWRTDLSLWQAYYRELHGMGATNTFPIPPAAQSPAEDVLLALTRETARFEALRLSCQRSQSRFPIRYEDGAEMLMPHLSKLLAAQIYLELRTLAHLESANTTAALEDLKLSFRLLESIRSEPIVISQLVRTRMLGMIVQAIWEGLDEHRWSAEQLKAIEAELSRLDFAAAGHLALRGERAMVVEHINTLRRTRDLAEENDWEGYWKLGTRWAFPHLIPGGWFQQARVSYVRGLEPMLALFPASKTGSADPKAIEETSAHAFDDFQPGGRFEWLRDDTSFALKGVLIRFLHAQDSLTLARTACALERYQIRNGTPAPSLETLIPNDLPQLPASVINRAPFKYRLTEDGRFVLYATGWNQTDEGGQPELASSGSSTVIAGGDWVWRYRPTLIDPP